MFGFQNDLTRATPADIAASAGTGSAVSSSYSSTSDYFMELLPAASRACLLLLSFYECGMFDAEAAAVAVVRRVCYGDGDASRTMLKQVYF